MQDTALRKLDVVRDFVNTLDLEENKDEITALTFALHDDSFASGSKDKTVIVWDRTKKAAKFTGEGHSDAITCLAFEDNGKYLASGDKGRDDSIFAA